MEANSDGGYFFPLEQNFSISPLSQQIPIDSVWISCLLYNFLQRLKLSAALLSRSTDKNVIWSLVAQGSNLEKTSFPSALYFCLPQVA